MVYKFDLFCHDKRIVVLQSLKVLHLSIIAIRFYDSPSWKIGCANYERFHKSGHIIIIKEVGPKGCFAGFCHYHLVTTSAHMYAAYHYSLFESKMKTGFWAIALCRKI